MLIARCILVALALGSLIYSTFKLTISFLKKYRYKKNSKIVVAYMKDIIKDIKKDAPSMNVNDLPDEDDVIVAEYDEEEDELVQDMSVCSDVDEKVKSMLKNNEGIVIFE